MCTVKKTQNQLKTFNDNLLEKQRIVNKNRILYIYKYKNFCHVGLAGYLMITIIKIIRKEKIDNVPVCF